MSSTCVIYDDNENYGRRLMGAISVKAQADFNVLLFTKRSELERFLDEREPELMLVSESGYYDDISKLYKGKLIVLTEEMADYDRTQNMGKNTTAVYRYQTIDKIYKEIVEIGGMIQRKLNGKINVIGIYTPIAVVDKNVFGLNLAKQYSLKYRTLYINFEEFSGLGDILISDNDMTLSDALYYYRQNNDRTYENIQKTIMTKDGLDYIPPIRCAEDISFIDTGQIIEFINYMSQQYGYEMIILDISVAVMSPWKLLASCNVVYVPERTDYISAHRLEDMKQYLIGAGLESLANNMRYIRIPEGENLITGDFWNRISGSGMYRFAKKIIEEA